MHISSPDIAGSDGAVLETTGVLLVEEIADGISIDDTATPE